MDQLTSYFIPYQKSYINWYLSFEDLFAYTFSGHYIKWHNWCSHFTSSYVKQIVITVELFSFIILGTMDEPASSNCNELSSQRQFSVTAPVLRLHNLLEEYSVWVPPSYASSAVSSQTLSEFHLMPWRITNVPPVSLHHIQLTISVEWSHNQNLAFATFRPNYFNFLRNHNSYMLPLASSTLFTHLGLFWSHYNNLMGSIKCR